LIDSSTQQDEQLVPLIVRYFHAEKVVNVMVPELVNLGGETSDLLPSYVLEVLQKLDLLGKLLQYQQIIIPIRTLLKREGKNNLYYKM
jgi:hypothetical protein